MGKEDIKAKEERAMIKVGQKHRILQHQVISRVNLLILNYQTILENGWFFVFIQAILLLSELLRFQRSLKNILSFRN